MSTTSLSITNFVNVSISVPPLGLSNYAINNLLIFTKETPVVGQGNYSIYISPTAVANDWGTTSEAYQMANLIFSQSPNILAGNGVLIIASLGQSELLAAGIARLQPLVFFGGILWAGYAPPDAEITGAAAVVQASKTLLFASDSNVAAVAGGGVFTTIQAASQTYTRCLLYTISPQSARFFAAAYAGRAMSTNFDGGSNVALTMHAKDLSGVLPDPGITQTLLATCSTVGADFYTTFGPLNKVYSTGGNTFYDQVYGQTWLAFALQVAGFNALATTSTKLPQTEPGMSILKNAYASVLQQGVRNGFLAPGAWNSSELFGDPVALVRNILQIGWYIYSQPVNQQSQANRALRQAPLVQIAVKLAGALQSSNVIVSVNP